MGGQAGTRWIAVRGPFPFPDRPCANAPAEEAIEFAEVHGVNCMVETFPLEDANKAYEKMLGGDVRFRSVLVME